MKNRGNFEGQASGKVSWLKNSFVSGSNEINFSYSYDGHHIAVFGVWIAFLKDEIDRKIKKNNYFWLWNEWYSSVTSFGQRKNKISHYPVFFKAQKGAQQAHRQQGGCHA